MKTPDWFIEYCRVNFPKINVEDAWFFFQKGRRYASAAKKKTKKEGE